MVMHTDGLVAIELGADQVACLERALDTYTRLAQGQLTIIADLVRDGLILVADRDTGYRPAVHEEIEKVEGGLQILKHMIGLQPGMSHSLGPNLDVRARRCYEMLKALQRAASPEADPSAPRGTGPNPRYAKGPVPRAWPSAAGVSLVVDVQNARAIGRALDIYEHLGRGGLGAVLDMTQSGELLRWNRYQERCERMTERNVEYLTVGLRAPAIPLRVRVDAGRALGEGSGPDVATSRSLRAALTGTGWVREPDDGVPEGFAVPDGPAMTPIDGETARDQEERFLIERDAAYEATRNSGATPW